MPPSHRPGPSAGVVPFLRTTVPTKPTTPPTRKRGRPAKSPDAGPQVRVYSYLTPAERDELVSRYGSVYAGLQQIVREKLATPKK